MCCSTQKAVSVCEEILLVSHPLLRRRDNNVFQQKGVIIRVKTKMGSKAQINWGKWEKLLRQDFVHKTWQFQKKASRCKKENEKINKLYDLQTLNVYQEQHAACRSVPVFLTLWGWTVWIQGRYPSLTLMQLYSITSGHPSPTIPTQRFPHKWRHQHGCLLVTSHGKTPIPLGKNRSVPEWHVMGRHPTSWRTNSPLSPVGYPLERGCRTKNGDVCVDRGHHEVGVSCGDRKSVIVGRGSISTTSHWSEALVCSIIRYEWRQ